MAERLRVLVSAPSLDVAQNVSGVSAVTVQIMRVLAPTHSVAHLQVGREAGVGLAGALLGAAKAAGIIMRGDYDIYHSNTALNPRSILRDSLLTGLAATRGRAVVVHLHGGKYVHEPAPRGWSRLIAALLRTRQVVSLSGLEAERVGTWYGARRVAVVFNGVEVAPTAQRIPRTDPAMPLEITFVGRLVEEKGILVLLEAARSLSEDGRFRFHIVGDGRLRGAVDAAAAAHPSIRAEGVATPAEVRKILAATDVLVLPSLSGEGMPMAVLEAMMAGVVPVATALSSVPEIIENDVTGLLLETPSAAALTSRLRELADAPQRLASMSAAAAAFARQRLCADTNYAALAEIYRAALA